MRSRFDTEVDKQLDLSWAKFDLNAKFYITKAQYDATVFEAFIEGARIALSLPLSEFGGAQ
jgi:5,10-methylenetetrahydrofolate reductase